MAQKGSNIKHLNAVHKRPSFAASVAYWTVVFGVNLYDLLGLCHLVPVHTLHLNRPYIVSAAQFGNNRCKKVCN